MFNKVARSGDTHRAICLTGWGVPGRCLLADVDVRFDGRDASHIEHKVQQCKIIPVRVRTRFMSPGFYRDNVSLVSKFNKVFLRRPPK